jgi:hypothetical protein
MQLNLPLANLINQEQKKKNWPCRKGEINKKASME